MIRFRAPLLVVLALCASLAITSCGGNGGGNDEDPQAVLEEAFNNSIQSGRFDLSFNLDSEGEAGGSFDANLAGPFQGRGDKFPQFDLDAEIKLDSSAQDFSASAGLISTGDKAFVSFQDTDYEVPQELFDQFVTSFNQAQRRSQAQGDPGGGSFPRSIGVDPTNWLTDLSNEGTDDVEGTETIHISGRADVPKLIEDFKTIAKRLGSARRTITPQQLGQLDQLKDTIKSADFDIYVGESDKLLRKLDARLELIPQPIPGAPDSAKVDFSLTLTDVDEPQTISAPSSAQPLAGLLKLLGIDTSQLGGALRGGLGSGGALPEAGGSPAAPGAGSTNAYLQCLQQAKGADAVAQCAQLLQQ